jgi:branched-chain amino acid transport system substrate-binding protein
MSDYDAVTIMALAAVAAHSTSPATFNSYIPQVTQPSPGSVVVHSYAEGLAQLNAGHKISYLGAAGVVDFDQSHNSSGSFELAAYKADGSVSLVDTVSAADITALVKK